MPNFLEDYEPVEDRLRAFWADYPDGRIETVMIGDTDERYVVQAFCYRTEEGRAASSGLASDSVDDLSPNMKSSALEVCETSAIGRALANLGYAPKGKRPSREEMASVSAKGKGGAEEITGGGPAVREDAAAHGAEPASPGYSKSQAACASTDHKDNRGRRHLKDGLCELCGMNAIAAMEGTTADLGSA